MSMPESSAGSVSHQRQRTEAFPGGSGQRAGRGTRGPGGAHEEVLGP